MDDDWLAANDLLPPTPPLTPKPEAHDLPIRRRRSSTTHPDPYKHATIASLRLKPVTTIPSNSACAEAVEVMRDKGFDQLPVINPKGPRLAGLVTLGNLLSYIHAGRVSPDDPVSKVMFDFEHISEVVTDPTDISLVTPGSPVLNAKDNRKPNTIGSGEAASDSVTRPQRRKFVEITKDTPLSQLSRFFEWNSAAVVTERDEKGTMKPLAVVTKVDLLTWLVKQKKHEQTNGK